MARKKKKSKSRGEQQPFAEPPRDEKLEEELGALKAIYDAKFEILEDRLGCSVHISPLPSDSASVSVMLEAR